MAPSVREAELFSRQAAELGEAPHWDADSGRLLWCDIAGGRAFASDERGTELICQLGGRASAIVPRVAGGHLIAADTELVLLDAAGAEQGRIAVEDPAAGRCLNDGAADAVGRFWIGSAVQSGQPRSASIFRVDRGGCRRARAGVSTSNGLGWSPDGTLLYTVDTEPRRVHVCDFDPESGDAGDPRPFARVADGLPDGLAVDAEGCVWLAVWGAGEVRRFSPRGTVIGRVRVPARKVSSCAFGGAGLRDLYITTAGGGASSPDEPLAGSIFVLADAADGLAARRVDL